MHSAFAARKNKLKSSPANVDFKTSILKLQKSANTSCTGRLEGMLMKLDPTQRYSIGVMVWTGAEGSQIKLSGTGREVEQICANLEVIVLRMEFNHIENIVWYVL